MLSLKSPRGPDVLTVTSSWASAQWHLRQTGSKVSRKHQYVRAYSLHRSTRKQTGGPAIKRTLPFKVSISPSAVQFAAASTAPPSGARGCTSARACSSTAQDESRLSTYCGASSYASACAASRTTERSDHVDAALSVFILHYSVCVRLMARYCMYTRCNTFNELQNFLLSVAAVMGIERRAAMDTKLPIALDCYELS